MKKKEKQIEEIRQVKNEHYHNGNIARKKSLAEKIYEKIIPEKAVLLTRKDAQKYFAYKIIEPQIKGCLDRERKLVQELKQVKEQAVKEFADKLRKNLYSFKCDTIIYDSELSNLAKEIYIKQLDFINERIINKTLKEVIGEEE